MKEKFLTIVLIVLAAIVPVGQPANAQEIPASELGLIEYLSELPSGQEAGGELVPLGFIASCGGLDPASIWEVRGELTDVGGLIIAAERSDTGHSAVMLEMHVSVAGGQTAMGSTRAVMIDAFNVNGPEWGFIAITISDQVDDVTTYMSQFTCTQA